MMNIHCLYHKNTIIKHVLSLAAVWEKTPGSITTWKTGIMKVRAGKMAQEYKPLSHKPDDQNLCKNSQRQCPVPINPAPLLQGGRHRDKRIPWTLGPASLEHTAQLGLSQRKQRREQTPRDCPLTIMGLL